MSIKRSVPTNTPSKSLKTRFHTYDTNKVNNILTLLHEELAVLDKVMYVQRNQHRRSCYYKSMQNLIRYCRKVENYSNDIFSNLKSYDELEIVDGLLQICCLIYKVILVGKGCAKNNSRQVSYLYFMPLCSSFLAASCRLIELNLLLLKEVLPLQQKYVSNNPMVYKDYLVPQSIVSLVELNSVNDLVDDNILPIVDDSMIAV